MTDWVSGFFVPLMEIVFVVGIGLLIGYWIGKGIHNAWTKSFKFILRYSIGRKKYPEQVVKWCYDAIEKGIGYYDAKKFLMVKMLPDEQVNETLWIYDKILLELKGGKHNDGQHKGVTGKVESTKGELPSI